MGSRDFLHNSFSGGSVVVIVTSFIKLMHHKLQSQYRYKPHGLHLYLFFQKRYTKVLVYDVFLYKILLRARKIH